MRITTLVCGAAMATTVFCGPFACAVDPGEGFGFGGPPQSLPAVDDDDDADADDDDGGGSSTDEGAGGSSTGGDDGPPQGTSTDPATSGVGDSSAGQSEGGSGETTDGLDSGSTGDGPPSGDDGGGQPDDGMYSHCVVGNECSPGYGCLTNQGATDGFCTTECIGPADPSGCAAVPSGTSTVTCIVVLAAQICALECSGGATCPAGMVCTSESDDNGPIEICM